MIFGYDPEGFDEDVIKSLEAVRKMVDSLCDKSFINLNDVVEFLNDFSN